jgi:hypothetical protein
MLQLGLEVSLTCKCNSPTLCRQWSQENDKYTFSHDNQYKILLAEGYEYFVKAVSVSHNLTMHFFVKFTCIIAECVWHEVVTMQLFNALCPSVKKCSNSYKTEHYTLTYLEPLFSQTDTHFRHICSISDSSVSPDTLINRLLTSKAYSWQPLKVFITNKQHIHNGSFVTILWLTQHEIVT